MHISPYEQGNRYNHDPERTRKLLLHRKQINKLIGETKEIGYSIVPLKIYLKNGYAKILIGLAKGKKKYDKREDLKQKEAKRDIERAFRDQTKNVDFTSWQVIQLLTIDLRLILCYNNKCQQALLIQMI